jgi:hypothetical protein
MLTIIDMELTIVLSGTIPSFDDVHSRVFCFDRF